MTDLMTSHDFYIWSSYITGATVLLGLAMASWAAKKRDEGDLRKLEKRMRNHAEEQV